MTKSNQQINIKTLEANNDIPGLIEALKSNRVAGVDEALTRLGAPAAELLLEEEGPFYPYKWDSWDDILVKMGSKAVVPLINALDSGHPMSYRVLGKIGDKRALKPLLDAFWNDGSTSKVNMMYSIGECRDKTTTGFFIDRLANDPDHEVRALSANWLGKIKDPQAVVPLLKALKNDEHESVQVRAAVNLAYLGTKKNIPNLIKAIGKNKQVNEVIGYALGIIGGKRAINFLLDACNSDDPAICIAGISGVCFCATIETIDLAIDLLLEAVNHMDKDIRLLAINRLCLLQIEEAVNPIMEIYKNSMEDRLEVYESMLEFCEGFVIPIMDFMENKITEPGSQFLSISTGHLIDQLETIPFDAFADKLGTSDSRLLFIILRKLSNSDVGIKNEFIKDPRRKKLLINLVNNNDETIKSLVENILKGGKK